MGAVYKKELKGYLHGMTGAIFAGFLLLMAGIYMTVYNLYSRYPNFEVILSNVSYIYLFIVPVLTMRSVAEEKHSKTDQLLYSLPMSLTSVVLAKYFAMLTVLAIPCAVMAFYPLILASFGAAELTTAYAMLFVFFLLGAALIAIGLFISSLTESQVIAAVISLGVLILLNFMPGLASLVPMTALASLVGLILISLAIGIIVYVMVKNTAVAVSVAVVLSAASVLVYTAKPALLEGLIPSMLNALAVFDRISNFQNGMFDLTAVVFYISVAALFVYLTVQSMEKKRWN